MARKKDLGKTSALSEEYVVDSDSDGQASANFRATLSAQGNSTNGNVHKAKEKPRKGSKASTKSVPQTERREKAGSMDEESEAAEETLSRAESSSSDGESQSQASPKAVQKPPGKRALSTQTKVLAKIPAKPYRAPPGFQEVKPDEVDVSSDVIKALSGDLDGKQLWHITAPASIPLKLLTTLSVDALQSGKPVLTREERQYSLSTNLNDIARLLLPCETGKTYKRTQKSISQSFHFREILQDPQSSAGKENQSPEAKDFFAKEKPEGKLAPKQRAELKMRYKPFGTSDEMPFAAHLAKSNNLEDSSIFDVPLASPSLDTSMPKKKKRRKVNQSEQFEQGIPGDHSMQLDTSPSRALTVNRKSSQDDALMMRKTTSVSGLGDDPAAPEKKRKKKKKSLEETSSATF